MAKMAYCPVGATAFPVGAATPGRMHIWEYTLPCKGRVLFAVACQVIWG
jgi:hypothetical protein